MSINFLESGVFWCSQALDLSLQPLAFSNILTVASRLLHPYITEDKSPRLIVKQLTARNTQRDSQSYTETTRGRRKIEVTRENKGRVKMGKINQVDNQIPK